MTLVLFINLFNANWNSSTYKSSQLEQAPNRALIHVVKTTTFGAKQLSRL